jgi:tetratricopeptide (TPR) repeat protein
VSQIADRLVDDATRAWELTSDGETARQAGEWARAVELHQEALLVAGEVFGETLATAVIAQNLAVTFKYTGRFTEAEALYRRALAIAEEASEHQLVATICHNLGGLAHARGDHTSGVPWARRSVTVREQGDDPLALAADQSALAGLLIEAGELDEAGHLLDTARATFVERLGHDHLEVAVIDGNLATVALRRDDLSAAERHAWAALLIKERRLGVEHPDLAVTLTTLGTIRRRRGDVSGAVDLHRRALDVLQAAVECDHPLLRTVEENLAVALSSA